MGVKAGISATEYPEQSNIGRKVLVMFNCSNPVFHGVVIRDDKTTPYETIFMLDDGRYIRSVECQYSLGGMDDF